MVILSILAFIGLITVLVVISVFVLGLIMTLMFNGVQKLSEFKAFSFLAPKKGRKKLIETSSKSFWETHFFMILLSCAFCSIIFLFAIILSLFNEGLRFFPMYGKDLFKEAEKNKLELIIDNLESSNEYGLDKKCCKFITALNRKKLKDSSDIEVILNGLKNDNGQLSGVNRRKLVNWLKIQDEKEIAPLYKIDEIIFTLNEIVSVNFTETKREFLLNWLILQEEKEKKDLDRVGDILLTGSDVTISDEETKEFFLNYFKKINEYESSDYNHLSEILYKFDEEYVPELSGHDNKYIINLAQSNSKKNDAARILKMFENYLLDEFVLTSADKNLLVNIITNRLGAEDSTSSEKDKMKRTLKLINKDSFESFSEDDYDTVIYQSTQYIVNWLLKIEKTKLYTYSKLILLLKDLEEDSVTINKNDAVLYINIAKQQLNNLTQKINKIYEVFKEEKYETEEEKQDLIALLEEFSDRQPERHQKIEELLGVLEKNITRKDRAFLTLWLDTLDIDGEFAGDAGKIEKLITKLRERSNIKSKLDANEIKFLLSLIKNIVVQMEKDELGKTSEIKEILASVESRKGLDFIYEEKEQFPGWLESMENYLLMKKLIKIFEGNITQIDIAYMTQLRQEVDTELKDTQVIINAGLAGHISDDDRKVLAIWVEKLYTELELSVNDSPLFHYPMIAKIARGFISFFDSKWYPPPNEPAEFGIMPLILGSIIVTFLTLCIAVPFGVGSALYISEVAKPKEKELLKPIIELLAGIPSVIYGLFGMKFLAPWMQRLFGYKYTYNALVASIILGIMVIPIISSISEDAINAVPKNLREASLGLGANKWETITRVVLPSARSGVITSIVLGIGRAIGETMVVLMIAGNSAVLPNVKVNVFNIFNFYLPDIFAAVRPMTSSIAAEMGETPIGSVHYHSLLAIAVVLFVFTFALNLITSSVRNRIRKKYE